MVRKAFDMKNKLTLLLLIGMAASSSCERYLDTQPRDFTPPEQYFNTAADLQAALVGVYDALGQDGTFSRNLVIELAHCNDEGFLKRDILTVNNIPMVYLHTAADPIVTAAWRQLYVGINRANYLLANLEKPEMDEADRRVIKGEALFLRGFMYFQLAHHFGEIPILLEPTEDGDLIDNPKKNLTEVYAQILRDMTEAEMLVRTYAQHGFPGRVSRTAVQAILARVCLKMAGEPLRDEAKYTDAKFWAEQVIASGMHSLNPSYRQIFINQSQDRYDEEARETIWEIEFSGNNITGPAREGGRWANHFAIRNTVLERGYGYATVGATATLYRTYESGDLRRDWNIATFRYLTGASSVGLGDTVAHAASAIYDRDIGKWRRYLEVVSPRGQDWGPTNFPVVRYADVLLMYVEAALELGDPVEPGSTAYRYFNMVRRRAYGYSATEPVPEAVEKMPTIQEIRDERSRELCFEGVRKFDLIRWGVFLQAMRTVGQDIGTSAPANLRYAVLGYNNVAPRHVLMPIPTQELALNKGMTQNPLW